MFEELKALMDAKVRNGEDGEAVVNGAVKAIREFATKECGLPDVQVELDRLAELLRNGE